MMQIMLLAGPLSDTSIGSGRLASGDGLLVTEESGTTPPNGFRGSPHAG